MLAVVLLSQHRVSSSKTVRPRAPCGAHCIGHAVRIWSAVCSEAPHSQFGEGARPHLYMDEWNHLKPVRKRLSLTGCVLNDALRIVTGCLRPTPTDHLPILSGIQPAELRRLGAALSLAYRGSLDPDHILHGLLSGSSDTGQARLRSRRPFVPAARNLFNNLARLGICASEWTNHKWKTEYCENASRLCAFVPGTGARPVGMGLPRATCQDCQSMFKIFNFISKTFDTSNYPLPSLPAPLKINTLKIF